MKVVLFCGGLGMRLRDYDENLPKPLVAIGYRPIMWHLMRYYARYNHKDFVLCLGHKGDVVKKYFLEYDEALSNDFVLSEGGQKVQLLHTDIHDWRITFADTGPRSSIADRLRQVRRHLEGEEFFLANYSDCLTDLDLTAYIRHFRECKVIAGLVTVAPTVSYHYIEATNGIVTSVSDVKSAHLRVNGGFFIFRNDIFDYLRDGEDLVDGVFHRLIRDKQLMAYEYGGFWKAMDTFKDKQQLDELFASGSPPWDRSPD